MPGESIMKRIKKNDFLLINCFGSYFQSIFNYLMEDELSGHLIKDDILLYFVDSYYKYTELDVQEMRNTCGDIGWSYQQLSLHKMVDGREIWDEVYSVPESLHGLQEFLLKNAGISLEKFCIAKKKVFEELVFSTLAENGTCIIGMDDYYNPMSQMVFKKQHNVHSIVLTGYLEEEDAFQIFDTNYSYPYTLSKAAVIKGFFSSYIEQELFIVRRIEGINNFDYKDLFQKYVDRKQENHIIGRLIDVYGQICDDENRRFCLDGFNGMISSKILPIVNMKRQIWKHAIVDYPEQENGIPETLRAIDSAWKSIILLNEVMIRKGIFTYYGKVLNNLEKVIALEDTLAQEETVFARQAASDLVVCV